MSLETRLLDALVREGIVVTGEWVGGKVKAYQTKDGYKFIITHYTHNGYREDIQYNGINIKQGDFNVYNKETETKSSSEIHDQLVNEAIAAYKAHNAKNNHYSVKIDLLEWIRDLLIDVVAFNIANDLIPTLESHNSYIYFYGYDKLSYNLNGVEQLSHRFDINSKDYKEIEFNLMAFVGQVKYLLSKEEK